MRCPEISLRLKRGTPTSLISFVFLSDSSSKEFSLSSIVTLQRIKHFINFVKFLLVDNTFVRYTLVFGMLLD